MGTKNILDPRSGSILISDPFLQDENFVRSVVLLCEHNDNGTFGLVLNKLSILKLNELVDNVDSLDVEVYVGGPVEQNTLHFIYYGEKVLEDSINLTDRLWWGGDFDAIVSLLKSGQMNLENVRFFIGYSGWASDQLKGELEENTWIVCEMDCAKNIFVVSPEELWRIILKNMGGQYQVLANYPIDPRLN